MSYFPSLCATPQLLVGKNISYCPLLQVNDFLQEWNDSDPLPLNSNHEVNNSRCNSNVFSDLDVRRKRNDLTHWTLRDGRMWDREKQRLLYKMHLLLRFSWQRKKYIVHLRKEKSIRYKINKKENDNDKNPDNESKF